MTYLKKERLDSIIQPMLDIQATVVCTIYDDAESGNAYDIMWFARYMHGEECIMNIRLVEMLDDQRFLYNIPRFKIDDPYDFRLHEILITNADYTDEWGYSFVSDDGIIRSLVSFTSYLIDKLN